MVGKLEGYTHLKQKPTTWHDPELLSSMYDPQNLPKFVLNKIIPLSGCFKRCIPGGFLTQVLFKFVVAFTQLIGHNIASYVSLFCVH